MKIWAAAAFAAAAPASVNVNALPDMQLPIGATALVRFDANSEPVVTAGAAAPLSKGELEMLAEMVGRYEEALGEKSIVLTTQQYVEPVAKDHVRFTFAPTADGKSSLLIIKSGFDQSFAYKARIGVGKQSQVTDVCQVVPGRLSIEHWPYKIDWIEIRDVHAVPWKEGDKPVCE